MAPATVRRAPYKDFLQPALHRRFSSTASILLAIAYVEALLLASWGSSWIWPWFPVGIAGVRTFFLFLCGLSIIVLRIAQYHVGIRTSNSAAQTFAQHVLKAQTFETLFSYALSGWLFSQVYLWSIPDTDDSLEWITHFSGGRVRLNERPVFFTVHLISYGVFQAAIHLWNDFDRLSLRIVKPKDEAEAQGNPVPVNPLKRFADEIPALLISSLTISIVALIPSTICYALFARSWAWSITLALFRPFYNLPKSNMLPLSLPFHWSLLMRCIWSGYLLSFIWSIGNSAFSIFLVKEPLKNGKPLTSESKDPNGSLLNGLKSKKQSIKAFAMWELAFIARDFETRRTEIYQDVDRQGGPMWSQVYGICLDAVKTLEARVDPKKPAAPPAEQSKKDDKSKDEKKRITQPVKEDAILVTTPQRRSFRQEVEKAVTHAATDLKQESRLSPMAKKAVTQAKDRFLAVQRDFSGAGNPESPVQQYALQFLRSPFGWPLRQEFRRRLTVAVLGTPYGEPSLYINAINAVSMLAVHSLREDTYGNVQRDIAAIVRTLTSTAKKLETFKADFPVHWADTKKVRSSPEVDGILDALKGGLSQLVTTFGPYSRDLRLSQTDMRLAREAAGVPQIEDQMRQLR